MQNLRNKSEGTLIGIYQLTEYIMEKVVLFIYITFKYYLRGLSIDL